MLSAIEVARQFARLAESDGELLDEPRLQHLMYYAQGWSLAWYLEPLFEGRLEAAETGPVVSGLRLALVNQANAAGEILKPVSISPRDCEIIDSVWHGYRRPSSLELSQMTRTEAPWLDARDAEPSAKGDRIITHAALLNHFGTLFTTESGEYPGRLAQIDRANEQGLTRSLEELLALSGRHGD